MTYGEEKRRTDAAKVEAAAERQRVLVDRLKAWLASQKAEHAVVGQYTGGPEFCAGWDAAIDHVVGALERGEDPVAG